MSKENVSYSPDRKKVVGQSTRTHPRKDLGSGFNGMGLRDAEITRASSSTAREEVGQVEGVREEQNK